MGVHSTKRFTRNEQTIVDSASRLEWIATPLAMEVTWAEAGRLVQACRVAGHSDWRLPTSSEIRHLGKAKVPTLKRAGFALVDKRVSRGAAVRFFASGTVMDVDGRSDALAGYLSGDFGLYSHAAVIAVRGTSWPVDLTPSKAEREKVLKRFDAVVKEVVTRVAESTPLPSDAKARAAMLNDIWEHDVATMISDEFISEEQGIIHSMLVADPSYRERFEAAIVVKRRN